MGLAGRVAGTESGAVGPRDVIHLHPEPKTTIVIHIPIPGFPMTAIARGWAGGVSGRLGTCQLCPMRSCREKNGMCLVIRRGTIPEADAPLSSTLGLRFNP